MSSSAAAQVRVLFVCMGNICRSPTAQGVFSRLVTEEGVASALEIDSAGTHAYHVGNPPDERAAEAAQRRGVDLSGQRARRVQSADFVEFDYVIAMDEGNVEDLTSICPMGYEDKIKLFMEFAENVRETEVPDPYYGGATGFERVLDLIESASAGLLATLRRQHKF